MATVADPKKKNISGKIFCAMLWGMSVLSLILNCASYFIALGGKLNMNMITFLLLGMFFTVIGNYMPKAKQSYSMGIKLPWTLNSEENWNRTHRLAGFVWTVGGLLMIVNGFVQWVWLSEMIVFTMIFIPIIYSFALYRKGI